MKLFTPMDCEVGLQPIRCRNSYDSRECCKDLYPDFSSYVTFFANIRFSSSYISGISEHLALARRDSIGTTLLVSQTQHLIAVQSEKMQGTAFQSVWSINPHQLVKPGVIPAEGGGAAVYVLLEGDNTPVD